MVAPEEQVDENSRSEDGQGCYSCCWDSVGGRLEWRYILLVPWAVVAAVSFEEGGGVGIVEGVDRLAWVEVVAIGIDH